MDHKFIVNPNGRCRSCTNLDDQHMLMCSHCDRFFHLQCVGLGRMPNKNENWHCIKCDAVAKTLQSFDQKVKQLEKSIEDVSTKPSTENKDILTCQFLQGIVNKLEGLSVQPRTADSFLFRQTLIDLPKFNGSFKDWPKFKQTFFETTKLGNFSDIENLNRLEKCLKGEALLRVNSLLSDSSNVSKIMNVLEERFGSIEQIYNGLMNDIIKIRNPSYDNPKSMVDFISAIGDLVINMESLHHEEYLNDPRLVRDLMKKLPSGLQNQWLDNINEEKTLSSPINPYKAPTIKDFYTFLKPKEKVAIAKLVDSDSSNSRTKSERILHTQDTSQISCIKCNLNNHKLIQCFKFKKMTPEEKQKFVTEKRLCFSCLGANHVTKQCRSARICNINNCKSKHNRMLHGNKPDSGSGRVSTEHTVNCHVKRYNKVFYQIVPITLINGNNKVETFAFLDSGSSVSLINADTAEQLQVKGVFKPMTLAWTNGDTQEDSKSMSVQISIKSSNNNRFNIKDLRTIENLKLPTQSLDINCLRKQFSYLKNVQLESYENATPTILLGLPHAYLFKGEKEISGQFSEPVAKLTKLGWVLYGNSKHDAHNNNEHLFVISEDIDDEQSIKEMMSKFFSVESLGVKVPENVLISKSDERALQIMGKTLVPTEKGYEIGLLWKDDNVNLPNSFKTALNRFLLLEKKSAKDPSLKEWYNNKIDEYLGKGYLRKLSPQESVAELPRTFYLPHFIIENKNKEPPKRRLVFDAAAKINGISLNSQLLSGPDMTESSLGIKMRFREEPIAVSGDIQEMFHQVGIRKEDRNSQRIVSRKNPNERLDIYEMQVMTFGATCSPACAQYVKNTNAKQFLNTCPEAVEAILKNHYVDDYLDSFNDLNKATKIVLDVIKIHDKAHFKMRNFISNSKSLLANLPSDRISALNEIKLDMDENVFEKVLGMYWNTDKDNYKFKITAKFDEIQDPTKRQLLSFVMSIYDPLGLIAHITIHSKIIMQDLWRVGIEWDDKIPDSVKEDWSTWLKLLSTLNNLRIPRCYSYAKNIIKRELHVFCDASARAYATVIYIRTIHDKGIDLTIVAGKSKVAPTKIMSIPRLELQAAVLGTRLANTVQKETRLEINTITHWSDSKTVLSWIKSEVRKYKQFVQYRISEILDTTVESQWQYIDTANNPADEGTKMITTQSKWVSGPDFLKTYDNLWKIGDKGSPDLSHEELRPIFTIAAIDKPNFDWLNIEWCSDWTRLKRSVCIVMKYIEWLKHKSKQTTFDKNITAFDMEKAEIILIKKAQWESFSDEVLDLTTKNRIEEESNIKPLTPILDKNGALVSNTRYVNVKCLPYGARQPYILPKAHYVSQLILKKHHEIFYHKKRDVAIAAVRLKYHIIQIKAAMNKVVNRCQYCKNNKAKAYVPQMAPLPECRTQPYVKPFTHTGVDYFGPYNVSIGRRTEKRWGVVFTCMTTRAVYLEVAHDLSADAFLVCLNSVQSRRGKIKFLYSDNGTNFVGADNELKKIRYRLASDGIVWTFNPPLSPHFGGAWERMVREIKSLLPSDTMPEHTLRALLTEIEFIINCRPLTSISLDATDDEPITPHHFLMGCAGSTETSLNDVSKAEASRQQWKRVQLLAKNYWDRWLHEYLPTQAKRSKWSKVVKNVKVGDIALIADDNQKAKWKKGMIIKIHTGKDGNVRSAVVKTANGEYTRPVVKLAVLDVLEPSKPKETEKQTKNIQEQNPVHFVGYMKVIEKPKANWGIRKQVDIDEVKKLASRLSASDPKPKRRKIIRPCTWMNILTTLYFICLFLGKSLGFQGSGLIAYDCSNPEVNLTSYSLLDVASCLPPTTNLSTQEIYIQVLQKKVNKETKVFQCKVIIQRKIRHCGMHSHTSDYYKGYEYIVKDFTSEECRYSQQLGTIKLAYDFHLHELKRNATTRGEELIVGTLSGSSCRGGTYKTHLYTWEDALVYYQYEITLRDYTAVVDSENDIIHLKNGLTCTYSQGKCLDAEDGYLTWDIEFNKKCEETEFEVLFEGVVNKTVNNENSNPMYSTITSTHLFSIRTKDVTRICGRIGYTTDHPRIILLETSVGDSPFTKSNVVGRNFDLFTYFNSKITFVENYFGQSMTELYNTVMTEMCKVDKSLLETKLTLARINPAEFVSSIIRRSGYTAVAAGEVLHVLECKPVYVTPRFEDNCYQEIPVFYNNKSMFIAPVTRILQNRGNQIDCTPILPAKFRIGGKWYTVDNKFRETVAPSKISTEIVTAWKYTPLPNLMESGVYDYDSVEKMKNMIYNQVDKRVASNVLHRLLDGHQTDQQGYRLEALNVVEKAQNIIYSIFESSYIIGFCRISSFFSGIIMMSYVCILIFNPMTWIMIYRKIKCNKTREQARININLETHL